MEFQPGALRSGLEHLLLIRSYVSSQKPCLPCKTWGKINQVCPVPLMRKCNIRIGAKTAMKIKFITEHQIHLKQSNQWCTAYECETIGDFPSSVKRLPVLHYSEVIFCLVLGDHEAHSWKFEITETPIYCNVFFVSKAIFSTFILTHCSVLVSCGCLRTSPRTSQ